MQTIGEVIALIMFITLVAMMIYHGFAMQKRDQEFLKSLDKK